MFDEPPHTTRFAGWLRATMASRGLSQAQLARSMGVADTQVSRWRRGQVVPTIPYLQRLADTFGLDRAVLDRLVGLPVAEGSPSGGEAGFEPELEAELRSHAARLDAALRERVPPELWDAYVEACVALADTLGGSARRLAQQAESQRSGHRPAEDPPHDRPLGFHP